MSKSKEEIPGFIPFNERKPELEAKVQEYVSKVEAPSFVSKRRYAPQFCFDPETGRLLSHYVME